MFRCGDLIDPYRLEAQLGVGAYGVVFAAVNTVSRQRVALKLVPLAGRAGKREQHALQQCCDLHHPNLLQIHHSGIAGDYLYYTMDLADGLLEEQHLAPADLRNAAAKLADALATLHAHGLLHRDIKPGNLFWRNGEPMLGDIGLVTTLKGASLTGTPGFLAPAIRNGEAPSVQSDLYALAKSFYCLLSGNPPGNYPQYNGPFEPDAATLLRAVLTVCDDDGSITSAAAFRDVLRREIPLPRHRKFRLQRWRARVAVLLAVLAIFGIWHVMRRPPERENQTSSHSVTPSNAKYARMMAALEKAAQTTPEEAAAIAHQFEVYQSLEAEAEREMLRRYPHREITSISYELERDTFRQNFLRTAVRQRAKQDAAFRCFYLLHDDVQQKAWALDALKNHPERTEVLQAEFQSWQEARTQYENAKNDLR